MTASALALFVRLAPRTVRCGGIGVSTRLGETFGVEE